MRVVVGFSTSNSLVSKTIRWFIGSNVSHTYLRFIDEFLGLDLIAHADWPGVVIIAKDKFIKQNQIIEEYEFEGSNLKQALVKNFKFLGGKYDYLSILGWAWTITFRRWTKIKLKNPLDDPKSMICVDFVIRFLNNAHIANIPIGSMNPKGILMFLRDNFLKNRVTFTEGV